MSAPSRAFCRRLGRKGKTIEADSGERLLKLEEAASLLGISIEELRLLVERGVLPAERIAGSFLRFHKAQVELARAKVEQVLAQIRKGVGSQTVQTESPVTVRERLLDFIQFNDFYIISLAIVLGILVYLFVSS